MRRKGGQGAAIRMARFCEVASRLGRVQKGMVWRKNKLLASRRRGAARGDTSPVFNSTDALRKEVRGAAIRIGTCPNRASARPPLRNCGPRAWPPWRPRTPSIVASECGSSRQRRHPSDTSERWEYVAVGLI